MKELTTENIELLDRVYNLRGNESVILVEMEKEMEESANSYEENSAIRQELADTINKLNNDVETLSDEGERLRSVLSGINEEDYAKLLETLNIDFHPESVKDKLDTLLPITVNGLVSDIKMSTNELGRVEEKLQEIKTKMEELNLRKEEALVNQDRLNRYFELAVNSNINVTREEVTSLFERLGFDNEESRECAKLLMFPEDGLFEYEKNYKDRPKAEPVVEEPDYSENFAVEDIGFEESPITFIDADEVDKEESVEKIEQNDQEQVIEPIVAPETEEEIVFENVEEESPAFEELQTKTFEEYSQEETPVIETVEEPVVKPTKDEVVSFLTDLGFDALDFTTNDIEKIMDNYNQDLIRENVNAVKELGISTDVFADNIELLYDNEMKKKIDKLTSVGKLPQDIYLYPSVLTKYNLIELDSAIKVLEDSGLEPKNVPLMAY